VSGKPWEPVAVVTGAASGIGRATTELLLERGGRVVAVDRTREGLESIDRDPNVAVVIGDVTTEEANLEAVRVAEARFGRVEVAVFNAGIPASGPIETLDIAVFDQSLAVNVRSVVLGLRAVIPAMRRAGGGSAVVTASITGLGGEPGRWPYAVAKAGVLNLVRSVAIDLALSDIRVNAVCPGPVLTGMTRRIAEADTIRFEALRRVVPQQRWGTPREVAEVIVFLASPLASFVTGVAVPVDGGISAGSGQVLPPFRAPDDIPTREGVSA
jgi:meso-butanediol dehydrogenase / (S,S)-butanediol dehydrogenase / diacetyl reductase